MNITYELSKLFICVFTLQILYIIPANLIALPNAFIVSTFDTSGFCSIFLLEFSRSHLFRRLVPIYFMLGILYTIVRHVTKEQLVLRSETLVLVMSLLESF